MRYYRWAGVGIVALAIIVFGGVSLADAPLLRTAQPQVVNTTVVQAAPTTPEDALIKITTANGLGSGVHVGDGFIVTAAHVVDGFTGVTIKTIAGVDGKADVLWVNKTYDIALLHTDGNVSGAAKLDCREPALGEQIQAAGNPLGIEFISSFGRVAGGGREMAPNWKRVVISDITTVMGQSGGPVFANDGRVIGINVGVMVAPLKGPTDIMTTKTMTGFGFVVPAKTVCMLMGRTV